MIFSMFMCLCMFCVKGLNGVVRCMFCIVVWFRKLWLEDCSILIFLMLLLWCSVIISCMLLKVLLFSVWCGKWWVLVVFILWWNVLM